MQTLVALVFGLVLTVSRRAERPPVALARSRRLRLGPIVFPGALLATVLAGCSAAALPSAAPPTATATLSSTPSAKPDDTHQAIRTDAEFAAALCQAVNHASLAVAALSKANGSEASALPPILEQAEAETTQAATLILATASWNDAEDAVLEDAFRAVDEVTFAGTRNYESQSRAARLVEAVAAAAATTVLAYREALAGDPTTTTQAHNSNDRTRAAFALVQVAVARHIGVELPPTDGDMLPVGYLLSCPSAGG